MPIIILFSDIDKCVNRVYPIQLPPPHPAFPHPHECRFCVVGMVTGRGILSVLYFIRVVCMYRAWNAANSWTYSGRERAECSISKDIFTCMYVCFTVFVCVFCPAVVEFISEIFSFCLRPVCLSFPLLSSFL